MWSKDGKTLYAGGWYYQQNEPGHFVLAWANAGRGEWRAVRAGRAKRYAPDPIGGLAALPDGGLLVAAAEPFLAVLEPDGRPRWAHPSPKAGFSSKAAAGRVFRWRDGRFRI